MKHFEEKLNSLESTVQEIFKENGYEMEASKVYKAGGVILTGITVSKKNGVCPCLYLENYINELENCDIADVAYKIYIQYMEAYSKIDEDIVKIVHEFYDFEQIKKRLQLKVLNTEYSKGYISKYASKEFLDLSILVYVAVSENQSITVSDEQCKNWGKTFEDILGIAVQNEKYCLQNMADILGEAGMADKNDECKMYVMSNKSRMYGAGAIVKADLLKQTAEKLEDDLLILPSSIHELIIIPWKEVEKSDDIKEMVREINDNMVSTDEILSYNIYRYSAKENRVRIL